MKKLLFFILFTLFSLFAQEEYEAEKFKALFDADGDGKVDTIEYVVQKSDMRNATVDVKISPTTAKPISFTVDSNVNYEIGGCKQKGCIKVFDADYGIWAEDTTSYYLYDKVKGNWFLDREVVESPIFDEKLGVVTQKRSKALFLYDNSERIDGKIIPNLEAHPLHALEAKAKKMPERFSNSLSVEYIRYYLENYPLNKKRVTLYNNVAFYLYKHGFNEEAVYILEKIVEKFPNRVVAYLNLADAYYALEENPSKYKKMYQTYVRLMKEQGKSKRVPKRVYSLLE